MKKAITHLTLVAMLACTTHAAWAAPAPSKSFDKAPPVPKVVPLPFDRPMSIAAVVNDDVITTQEVEDRALLVMALTGQGATPESRARLVSATLGTLIDETLQLQEAKRQSVTVKDEEITAAMAGLEKARNRPAGSLLGFVESAGLSKESITNQFKAQIAWNKAVSRKIRRTLNVTDAEIARAQQAALTPRNVPQVLISAISLPLLTPKDEPQVATLAKSLGDRLNKGESFESVARSMSTNKNVVLVPTLWVDEAKLEPGIAQAVRNVEKGGYTQPIRSQQTYQIIRLLDRREVPPVSPNTEVAVKQMQLSLPPTAPIKEIDALMQIAKDVQANPGTCGEAGIAGIESFDGLDIRVNYVRSTFKQMNDEMRSLVIPMGVGDVSVPYATKSGLELLMLCEKIEAPLPLPDREQVKDKIFAERAELEAERMLRNLKRDAFIEIKSGDKE